MTVIKRKRLINLPMFQLLHLLDALLNRRLLLLRGGRHQPVEMVTEHMTVDSVTQRQCVE